jgi:acyl-CoA reductase-like NAD-dependent aldehyde dehydrogenase
MLVLRDDLEEVGKMVAAAVEDVVVGDPRADGTRLGPVVSRRQHERVSGFIAEGVDCGLDLLTGGPGRPPQLPRGYYVRPTVFTDVPSTHHLAQEEIFGPVLCMIAGESIDDLAAIANDSRYGLAGAVWAATTEEAVTFARRIRTGQVQINGGAFNLAAPYGGFKQSGIGREHGLEGLAEYTELKSMQLPA